MYRITLLIALIATLPSSGFALHLHEPPLNATTAARAGDIDSVNHAGTVTITDGDPAAATTDLDDGIVTITDDSGASIGFETTSAQSLVSADASRDASASGAGCSAHDLSNDRVWLISTRRLPHDACAAPLQRPGFAVQTIDHCGQIRPSSLEAFLDQRSDTRPVLIHVHGNRMSPSDAIERGLFVHRSTARHCDSRPLDFVIFSWPSEQQGILLKDGREKAERTDAEGLYLAWLVRELTQRQTPIAIIGFSFGGRVATGALHAMAGGRLGGRTLPGEHVRGAGIAVGLIAPALEDDWLRAGQYHGLASQNMRKISILFNRRDAVLKRYWLIDAVRGSMALGFTGPRGIAPGVDGLPLPIVSRDCSPSLGIRHDEQEYYNDTCRAGRQMAQLIADLPEP